MILEFSVLELYDLYVLAPTNEFLFLLYLACNMDIKGSVSLSSYRAAFMCHTAGNLKIRNISLNLTAIF